MESALRVPALAVINGKPIVSSLQIAEAFDKQHKNVLRDIEEILTQVPDSFGKLNFELSEYAVTNALGFAVPRPMYRLARDGFMLVTMGYAGHKAMAIKIAYIEEFNRLEALARRQQADTELLRAQRDALWAWLCGLKPEVGKIARYRRAGLTRDEVARALGWGEKRVRNVERRLRAIGLLPASAEGQLSLLEG